MSNVLHLHFVSNIFHINVIWWYEYILVTNINVFIVQCNWIVLSEVMMTFLTLSLAMQVVN